MTAPEQRLPYRGKYRCGKCGRTVDVHVDKSLSATERLLFIASLGGVCPACWEQGKGKA